MGRHTLAKRLFNSVLSISKVPKNQISLSIVKLLDR